MSPPVSSLGRVAQVESLVFTRAGLYTSWSSHDKGWARWLPLPLPLQLQWLLMYLTPHHNLLFNQPTTRFLQSHLTLYTPFTRYKLITVETTRCYSTSSLPTTNHNSHCVLQVNYRSWPTVHTLIFVCFLSKAQMSTVLFMSPFNTSVLCVWMLTTYTKHTILTLSLCSTDFFHITSNTINIYFS